MACEMACDGMRPHAVQSRSMVRLLYTQVRVMGSPPLDDHRAFLSHISSGGSHPPGATLDGAASAVNAALVVAGLRPAARLDDGCHTVISRLRTYVASHRQSFGIVFGAAANEPLLFAQARVSTQDLRTVRSPARDWDQPVWDAYGRLLGYPCVIRGTCAKPGNRHGAMVTATLRRRRSHRLETVWLMGCCCASAADARAATAAFKLHVAEPGTELLGGTPLAGGAWTLMHLSASPMPMRANVRQPPP